jgi:hypothetical protein
MNLWPKNILIDSKLKGFEQFRYACSSAHKFISEKQRDIQPQFSVSFRSPPAFATLRFVDLIQWRGLAKMTHLTSRNDKAAPVWRQLWERPHF